ncbi:MAG TPA: type IV pilin protein [Caldimonas sp.]|jgi:type IV pilus assembly protein PilE
MRNCHRPSTSTFAPRRARSPRSAGGFTLIETMVALVVAGVLSSIAYPGVEAQVQRARRTDALVALMQAQLAEERYRANNAGYASLADLGLRDTSSAGHYRLQAAPNASGGYELVAGATAMQARDARCRYLRLSLADGALVYASGNDATTANGADANRACWNR